MEGIFNRIHLYGWKKRVVLHPMDVRLFTSELEPLSRISSSAKVCIREV